MRRRPATRECVQRVVALVAGVALVTACSSDDGGAPPADASSSPSATRGSEEPGGDLEWSECGTIECAVLAVPLDPADPRGERIELALGRRPADGERRGTLLVNPGGPGASGRMMPEAASELFEPEVLEHYDVVGWDPRGVGASTAVDCLDDLDPFWALDRTPDTPAEAAAIHDEARALAAGCGGRSGALLPYLGSRASVEDMDRIRAALGDDRLTYVGYSYGTLLGLLYADAHPDRVQAMVLDGPVDPSLSFEEAARAQGVGFDRALDDFLGWCVGRCELGRAGDGVTEAFAALLARIDAAPVPGDGDRMLGPGETEIAIATALYGGEDAYPYLASALEDAAAGDGTAMLRLADVYTGRLPDGGYDNEAEAFYATSCADGGAPASVAALEAIAERVGRVAPYLGEPGVWLAAPCVHWPVPPDPVAGSYDAAGAPTILVVRTLRDPATPPAWGAAVARALADARLVTLDADGHLASGRGSDCVDDVITGYLVDLAVPPADLRCEP